MLSLVVLNFDINNVKDRLVKVHVAFSFAIPSFFIRITHDGLTHLTEVAASQTSYALSSHGPFGLHEVNLVQTRLEVVVIPLVG